MTTPLVQRAFELVESGEFQTTTAVRQQLFDEGYSANSIRSHLEGATIRKSLKLRLRERLSAQTP